jgi:hypothetical protein
MKDNKECCSSEESRKVHGHCGHGHKHGSCACGGQASGLMRLVLTLVTMLALVVIGYGIGSRDKGYESDFRGQCDHARPYLDTGSSAPIEIK